MGYAMASPQPEQDGYSIWPRPVSAISAVNPSMTGLPFRRKEQDGRLSPNISVFVSKVGCIKMIELVMRGTQQANHHGEASARRILRACPPPSHRTEPHFQQARILTNGLRSSHGRRSRYCAWRGRILSAPWKSYQNRRSHKRAMFARLRGRRARRMARGLQNRVPAQDGDVLLMPGAIAVNAPWICERTRRVSNARTGYPVRAG